MKDPHTAARPLQIRVLYAFLGLLAVYCGAVSPLMCFYAIFGGPYLLAFGVAHGVLAPTFLVLRKGLNERREWVKWGLAILSIMGLVVPPILAVCASIEGFRLDIVVSMLVVMAAAVFMFVHQTTLWRRQAKPETSHMTLCDSV